MASTIGRYSNPSGIALTAATAKTVIQVTAPANQRVDFLELTIGFAGTFADGDDIKIRLLRQTTAGTMTAATEVHADSGRNLTLQSAVSHTATAEPTAGDDLFVHYFSGFHQRIARLRFPTGDIVITENTRLGVEVTSDAAATCYPSIVWAE
jgi:hypothetical protein